MEERDDKIERPRMAALLGLNQRAPETWPLSVLDALIRLETQEGRVALVLELNKLCCRAGG